MRQSRVFERNLIKSLLYLLKQPRIIEFFLVYQTLFKLLTLNLMLPPVNNFIINNLIREKKNSELKILNSLAVKLIFYIRTNKEIYL